MKPTIGRIVHYREAGGPAGPDYDVAAMIVATPETQASVPPGSVNLLVYGPTGGQHTELGVKENPSNGTDRELIAGTWRWPERVS